MLETGGLGLASQFPTWARKLLRQPASFQSLETGRAFFSSPPVAAQQKIASWSVGVCLWRTTRTLSAGTFFGRVRFFGVSVADKKLCPMANFKLRYTKKETNSEMKEGSEEARELTARNYGRDEWWVLLDPVPNAAGGS